MSGTEVFTNYAQTTATSTSGTTAPASGTTETWTVTSSASFPGATTGVTTFHIADPALPGEVIQVTNVSGTTWTVIRGAESTTPVAHATGATFKQVVSAGFLTTLASLGQTSVIQPSGDTTGTTDTTNINNAITTLPSTGGIVALAPGLFYINKPIVIQQNGVILTGSGGPVPSGDDAGKNYGTTIKVVAGFTNPTFSTFATAAILLMDQNPGVTGGATFSPHVKDLWLNLVSAPASVDGIALFGAIQAVAIVNVGINQATNNGINFIVDSASSSGAPYADGVYMSNIMIQSATNNGINSAITGNKISDAVAYSIHAQSCGGDGFYINWGNGNLVNCRADHCTNGFTVDSPPGGSGVMDSITFVGCSTENNNQNGFNIVNTSTSGTAYLRWVQISGCKLGGDGNNGGAGGGGFAGILVSGANIVTIDNTHVLVRTNQVAGGTPQYGVATAAFGTGPGKPNIIVMTNCLLNYVTSAVHDSAPAAVFNRTACYGASGFEPTTFTAV